MEELLLKLREKNLIDDTGNIILDERQTVDVDTFQRLFGDKPYTYENLIGSHTFIWFDDVQYTKTAEELGYKVFFDKWKDIGIL